jgi:hypothetical protein
MIVLAYAIVVLIVLNIIVSAYYIDKPRDPTTPTAYLLNSVFGLLIIILCGRVIGWW